jgi:hypothetical protein
MPPRGDLGHDPAEAGMQVGLRRDDVAHDPAAVQQRSGRLVARGL